MTDHDLIRDFAATRSEQAFRRLVDRHCDLVYSVASRVTQNAELARDVSQQVFSKLAAKPRSVPPGVPFAAWLHRTTRSCAIDLVRSEEARRKREAALTPSAVMNIDPSPDWSRVEPVIDSLIDQLPELERRALVLRYYEKRSHGMIGSELGLSEEATRKRLDRALEKLRGLLAKRGISTSSAALATILPAHATSPAPAGFSASISSTALSTTATAAAASSSTSILAIIMSHKAIVAGASLLLLAGVAAVAVPLATKDKPAPALAIAAPGGGQAGGATKAGQDSQSKSRSSAATARLSQKYGDSRTKLSGHLVNEMMAMMEDTFKVMEITLAMNLVEHMADADHLLGESAHDLALTDDQKKQIANLQADVMKREFEKAREHLAILKKDPAKIMELLLAGDALKRGEMGRPEYDSVRAAMDLPDPGISMTVGGGEEAGEAMDDPVFREQVAALLNEEQQKIFQEAVAARPSTGKAAEEEKVVTLEECEKELKQNRKVIQGALQMIEGITGGGLLQPPADSE